MRPSTPHGGYTTVEFAIVAVVVVLVAALAVFLVRDALAAEDGDSCAIDVERLVAAADVYMAEHNVDAVPALGTSDDRHELFLVDEGLIKQISTKYDLAADGTVSTTGQPCT